jgi:hypothetical protein
MTGGLMQLLAWGNQNMYICGNPCITYFKKVYNKYTNFSMESKRINFSRDDVLINETTTLKATIDRNGDMVGQMYFVFELPDVKFDDNLIFKWVEDIGDAIIDSCQLSINGTVVDKQTGEFKHLYRHLSYGIDKQYMYEKMSGQRYEIPTRKSPFTPFGQVITAYSPQKLSSRKVYIPLNFWFNRTLSQALPLVSLQYSEVELTMELRPVNNLYRLYYTKNGVSDFYAPDKNNPAHALSAFVDNTQRQSIRPDSVLDINAYLEVNYIYLDKTERNMFVYKPLEYLVEQTTRINKFGIGEYATHDLLLTNTVKEIFWVCSRNDKTLTNDWFNYTDSNDQIMITAKLMFNGLDRFDEKDAVYFNYVQPFQHHRANYKDGLYVYSFAINADDTEQPSGACNCSMINNIQMYMRSKKPNNTSYAYDLTIYAISYNLLRIEKGTASLAFSL